MLSAPAAGVLLIAATLTGCHREGASGGAGASGGDASPSATGAPPAASAAPGQCLSAFDFLVPYQSYKSGDVIRAITVAGDHVLFRNADDLMRVPLAGGPPVVVGKAPSMTLQFDARPTMWLVGDKLVTQSPGAPAFLEAPTAGGAWTTLVNLTGGELGSRLETGQHVVNTLLSGSGEHAHPAMFDGKAFYWIESHSGSKGKPGMDTLRTVPLSGSPAKTLYEWEGDLKALAIAGDRLVFERTDPQKKEPAPPRHTGPKGKLDFVIPPHPPTHLASMPVQGGSVDVLSHVSSMEGNIGTGDVLFTDGDTVYVTGFQDEDIQKPGIFRISARPGSVLERIDDRHVSGEGFVYGDHYVIAGHGPFEPKAPGGDVFANLGIVVLTGDRHGGPLQRVACIHGNYTVHAYAVTGKTLLVSIFKSDDKQAAIIRVPLP
jgi:hypothetical protein